MSAPQRSLIIAAALGVAVSWFAPDSLGIEPTRVRVFRVVGADTFIGSDGERIRTLGVVSPETTSEFLNVRAQAEEALQFTSALLKNKTVELRFDRRSVRDLQGRLLAYVYLEDGTSLNEELLRRGYGTFNLDLPDLREKRRYETLETEARDQKLGLWKDISRTQNTKRKSIPKPPRKVWWKDDSEDNWIPSK